MIAHQQERSRARRAAARARPPGASAKKGRAARWFKQRPEGSGLTLLTFGRRPRPPNVVVPEGDGPSVKGLDGQMVINPDYIVMGHELLGETFKLMPGNQNLLNDSNADSQSVVDFDNLLRRMHGLPLRSGEDHGPFKATVSAGETIQIERAAPSLDRPIRARKIE